MNKYLFGGLAALIVLGGGVYFYSAQQVNADPQPGEKPWIEVVAASVFTKDGTGMPVILATGDELTPGEVITTNSTGVAVIHFPDGSFAKLDSGSSVTITTASYDKASGSLQVHLSLGTGTLWSKVLDLIGKDSSWQVQTSNAVATVRGTAFGVFAEKGKTKVVGIEHKVDVAAVNLVTKEVAATSTAITENAQVSVDDAHVPALVSGKEKLVAAQTSSDVLQSNGFREFTQRADKFNTDRQTVQTHASTEKEFRTEFREERVKPFKKDILKERQLHKDVRTGESKNTDPDAHSKELQTRSTSTTSLEKTINPDKTRSDETSLSTTPEVHTTVSNTTEGGSASVAPVSLTITSDRALDTGMTEKDIATFHAILLLSDNSKKDVTQSVVWHMLNPIGTFTGPGVFRAELSADNAELGEVSGAVYATFTKSDGKELNGATQTFKVRAAPSASVGTDG